MDNNNISNYYDYTQHHYERWWKLKESLSLHYGFWDEGVQNFNQALINTNKVMMELAKVGDGDTILDAGCGVGGTAIFLASNKNVKVNGITLSERQIKLANEKIQLNKLESRVKVSKMDFTHTNFPDDSFDLVWACESMCHAEEKSEFLKEAYRVLKPGGKLIVNDYFLPTNNINDKKKLVQRWADYWYMYHPISSLLFENKLKECGFSSIQNIDQTNKIEKSARIMYNACMLGAIPSILYNITHPNATEEAKHHYKSGILQYRALKKGLWTYNTFVAKK